MLVPDLANSSTLMGNVLQNTIKVSLWRCHVKPGMRILRRAMSLNWGMTFTVSQSARWDDSHERVSPGLRPHVSQPSLVRNNYYYLKLSDGWWSVQWAGDTVLDIISSLNSGEICLSHRGFCFSSFWLLNVMHSHERKINILLPWATIVKMSCNILPPPDNILMFLLDFFKPK